MKQGHNDSFLFLFPSGHTYNHFKCEFIQVGTTNPFGTPVRSPDPFGMDQWTTPGKTAQVTLLQSCGENSDCKKPVLWIRIRIGSVFRTFVDPHMLIIQGKIEAKSVRFKIYIKNSEPQLTKNFFGTFWSYCF